MLTFVIYDISDNKIRNKVADICLDYGLVRIQLSAFEGYMSAARRIELARRIQAVLKGDQGEAQIITCCKADREEHLRITAKGIGNKEYRPRWESLVYVVGGEEG